MLEKHCDPSSFEQRLYEEWEKSGLFEAGLRPNAPAYTIMIPPPNVTGNLHIGHAFNNTLQDIFIRFRRMQGYDCLWQAGTDHAGIATQMVVERQLAAENKNRRDMGREAFIKRVWQWKQESGGQIEKQLKRLGASADWERSRFTMDEGLSLATLQAFVTLYQDGLVYRDLRLVNWDPHFETAISDLEVQQIETKGHLWYIDYPVIDNPGSSITIATTRPETMLGGDVAIAVHPDDARWKHMVGKICALPFVGKEIPIIADDFVDTEQGSGAVKISPGHDFNDFEVGLRHKLTPVSIFDRKARIQAPAPEEWRNLDKMEARKKIIVQFEKENLLVKTEPLTHMVPHGDRSGKAVEPFLTKQWFVDTRKMANPALKAVKEGRIEIIPDKWVHTYNQWLENIQPWCISRQLWWGHQLPVWYGPDETVFVAMKEEEALKQAEAHYGKPTALTRDPDVLDTWFSSALWPFSTLGWPAPTDEFTRRFPTDILITAFDIIFFWVARMIMFSLHLTGDIPFRKVYIHALVRDKQGHKMSKSKGNVLDPLEIIDEFGADAVRFTLASLAAPGRDLRLSTDRIAGNRRFITKIWNASRFAVMNQCHLPADFNPAELKKPLNKWLISEIASLTVSCEQQLEAGRFDEAAQQLYRYIWTRFCDWYLEFAKIPLAEGDSETRHTVGWAFAHLLKLLHPLMPFVTSEIHAKTGLGGFETNQPLMTAAWPEAKKLEKIIDQKANGDINQLIRLIGRIRSIRTFLKIEPARKISLTMEKELLGSYRREIIQLARLSEINVGDLDKDRGIAFLHDGVRLALNIADIINIAQERKRLNREIADAETQITDIEKRLNNRAFCEKAPAEIITAQQEKMALIQKEREELLEIRQGIAR